MTNIELQQLLKEHPDEAFIRVLIEIEGYPIYKDANYIFQDLSAEMHVYELVISGVDEEII